VRRFLVLAFLYMAQGLPFGFFSHAVPVLLNRTHPAELVGLSGLLGAPWAFKFVLGPAVDRAASRRRIIVPMNLACVVALVALGFARPSADHLAPLLAGFFLVSVFSAFQDVATDALALDLLDEAERGRGGAIQVAAQRVGIIAGGGGVLAMIDWLGYAEAFWLMAALILALTLPVLSQPEPPRAHRQPLASGARGASLLASFFSRPDAKNIVGLVLFFKLGDALAAGMVTRWFVKQGLSNAEIASTRGLIGGLSAVVGALAGAALYRAMDRKRAVATSSGLQAAAIAMYLALDLAHPHGTGPLSLAVYACASGLEHALGGAATAVLFARMMDLCRDEARATDYTVQACLLVVVTGLGIVASGFVVKLAGLRGLFAIATALGAVGPLAVHRFWSEQRPAGPAARATRPAA
jgi:PAT family beta-lactamase induction signal transducer AmpG